MITIKDIADRLDIAPSTVSKGLNDANDISPDLKQLVIDTAIEMGYVSKKMKRENKKRLCLFIENMLYKEEKDFGFDLVLGFKQAAYRNNWIVDIVELSPQFQTLEPYDRYMTKHNYHGGFLLGLALKDPWMKQFEKTTIPTVLLDNYIRKNPNVCYIGTDSYEGIDIAIEHLEKLGHTRIALLNGSKDSMITTNRYEAFYMSMQNHDLPLHKNLIAHGHYVEESAKYHCATLIENGATAIICGNDLLAVGVIKECSRLHIRVPEDISVIGFDNLPIAEQITPGLTTISQDRIDLGKNAYAALFWLIQKVPISRSLLRPSLITRNSTGKCIYGSKELPDSRLTKN